MSISPNGYNYTISPDSDNPFWVQDGDGGTTKVSYNYHQMLGSPDVLTDTNTKCYKVTFSVDGNNYTVTTPIGLANRNNVIPFYRGEYVDLLYFENGGDFTMTPSGILTMDTISGVAFVSSAVVDVKADADVNATASIDATTGTPSVTVSKTTADGVTNFDFAFSGIKGADGTSGTTPQISAQASADNTTGTPQVTVDVSGTTAKPDLSFYFSGIKGEKGEKGDSGEKGADGTNGTNGVTPEITATGSVDSTSGTPSVTVSVSGTTAKPNIDFAFTGIKGVDGTSGTTPNITMTAGVYTDETTTESYVDVTKSGSDTAPNYVFDFYNISGGGSSGTADLSWKKIAVTDTDIPTTDADGNETAAYCTINNFIKYLVQQGISFSQIMPPPMTLFEVEYMETSAYVNGVSVATVSPSAIQGMTNVCFNPIDVLPNSKYIKTIAPHGVYSIGQPREMTFNEDTISLFKLFVNSPNDLQTNESYSLFTSGSYSTDDGSNTVCVCGIEGTVTAVYDATGLTANDKALIYNGAGMIKYSKIASALSGCYVYYR